MRESELFEIYNRMRRAEFRRRELQRLIVQERETATALHSFFGGVKVSGGIRTTPQDKYLERVSDYEAQLRRTVREANETAKRYFYDVQELIPWRMARQIHGFITCSLPYSNDYAEAVKEMAQALTDGKTRAAAWDNETPRFSPSMRHYIPPSKPLTKEQTEAITRRELRKANGKPLPAIVNEIRRKCKRRRCAEKGSKEDETLYVQICALERVYVYAWQRHLTEQELVLIECYMTDELSDHKLKANKNKIERALEKISAARTTAGEKTWTKK